MVYLDLDELDEVFEGRLLWSTRRPAVAWFRRADYLGRPDRPLRDEVLDRVAASGRARPRGPVRMLTHLRYLGYAQNPVTFYYCFSAEDDGRIQAVVAEVTNTPWGERHAYVVDGPDGGPVAPFARFPKAFHVSPFMPMEQQYRWRFSAPGADLAVDMESVEDGRRVFDATLRMTRRPITGRSLAGALARHPWMTARVVTAIYAQALRLWLKRTPFFDHPKHRDS